MPKIIGLDYGTKRVGVAVTDELQIIASGLTTVHSSEIIVFLKNYFLSNEVEIIVIGKPVKLDGTATDSSEAVHNFRIHLERTFPEIKIVDIDERFTSKIASRTLYNSGLKKKKRQQKGLIDEISAVILLQDFLKRRENGMI